VPPAVVAPSAVPARKVHVAATARPRAATHRAKFAELIRRLAATHPHPATAHVVPRQSEFVAIAPPEPRFPPGMVVPPPGYYGPGPREHLVYGGPPRGLYGWGGYRGPNPYYP